LLVDCGEPDALEQDLLGHLGAQIRVRRLLVDKHAAELAELRVDRGDLQLDGAGADVELLVVLVEERLVAASLQRGSAMAWS